MPSPGDATPKEDKSISPAIVVAGIGVLLAFLTLVLYLWHEKDHDHSDYTVPIVIVALLVLSIVATLLAVVTNIKDAIRAKSLHAQIVTIKDEFRTQIEGSTKAHLEELQKIRSNASEVPATSTQLPHAPQSPQELREKALELAGDLCAFLMGHGEQLDPPPIDNPNVLDSVPDNPEIRDGFPSRFGTRVSDIKARLGERGLLDEKFKFSSIGDALDGSTVRNAEGIRQIISGLALAAKIVDEKFIRGGPFAFASGARRADVIVPSRDNVFELIWKLKEFHRSLPPPPGVPKSVSGLTAENADGYAAEISTSIRKWSDEIRHGYEDKFSSQVNGLIHKLGSKGMDVRAPEEHSKHVETDENVSNVIESLQQIARDWREDEAGI